MAQPAYREAVARDDPDAAPVWVGQAVDLVTTVESAGDLVAPLAAEAELALARAHRCRVGTPERGLP